MTTQPSHQRAAYSRMPESYHDTTPSAASSSTGTASTTKAISLRRRHGMVSGELYCSTLTCSASTVTMPANGLAATRRAGTSSMLTAAPTTGTGGASASSCGSTNAIEPVPPAAEEISTGIVI